MTPAERWAAIDAAIAAGVDLSRPIPTVPGAPDWIVKRASCATWERGLSIEVENLNRHPLSNDRRAHWTIPACSLGDRRYDWSGCIFATEEARERVESARARWETERAA